MNNITKTPLSSSFLPAPDVYQRGKFNSISRMAATIIVLLGITACGSDTVTLGLGEGAAPAPAPVPTAPFQEVLDQGIDRFEGEFVPASATALSGGVVAHNFNPAEENGPLCFTGNEFRVLTRNGTSNDLMIFLQGGGACGPVNCDAVESAPLVLPAIGILDATRESNPAADYNLGYLPYCDGTFFSGDNDVDSDGDGVADRFFRGVQNLQASLDLIVSTYPAPDSILLTGNSAGGFGTHYALPLVRKLYPDVPIELVNDSGVGVSQPGAQNALIEEWNSGAFFPASCDTCIGEDGHLTDYHAWQLNEDQNLRMGFMSTKQDATIADGLNVSGEVFEVELLAAMAELREAFPVRFRSLIAEGNAHTFILLDFTREVGGTTIEQWVSDMLSGSENWVSVSD